ncbi:kinase [Hirsutella rhossiliensis]
MGFEIIIKRSPFRPMGGHISDQLDLFFYTGDEVRFEDLTKYKQYGLHPIVLGDVLPKPSTCVSDLAKKRRYRILLKLGVGAFATVWLARDLVDRRYVAVKVCQGSDFPRPSRETEILSQLRKNGPGRHGYQRVIQLFDVYVVKGPNGFHECLVTEVIAPLSDPDVMRQCSSEAVRQIIEGFAFLHEQGIAHGDPHIANFGIAIPQILDFKRSYRTSENIPLYLGARIYVISYQIGERTYFNMGIS